MIFLKQCFLWMGVVLACSSLLLEVGLRLAGVSPLQPSPFMFSTQPTPYVRLDTTLGYTFLPGRFKITYTNGFTFSSTHNKDGRRVVDNTISDTLPQVLLMGCSFAYGQGVNDTQTMAYYCQQKEKGYKIQNYAVGGYGTVQQCLQLEAALKEKQLPAMVIFTYASFHHERNAGSRQYIKRMAWGSGNSDSPIKIPYWNPAQQLCYCAVQYPLLYFCSKSALINAIDDTFNSLLLKDEEIFTITSNQIYQATENCQKQGVSFCLLALNNDSYSLRLKDFCAKKKIPFSMLSFANAKENHALYYLPDGHPTSLLQRYYADALVRLLTH